MWVRFTADFDWNVPEYGGRVTMGFKAAQIKSVRRACGEAAIQAGKAVLAQHPTRENDNG